jgi:protein-disulfide isomerase
MARRKRVPARASRKSQNAKQTKATPKNALSRGLWVAAVLTVAIISAALIVGRHNSDQAEIQPQIDRTVSALFAGIPQEGATLGTRTAPVTMEVFIDLKDPTSRWWFREDLPAIVTAYVRTGALELRYHAFKRNTYRPAVFVREQTAALAAGAQDKLWNYIDTFFYEQGKELTDYVTESYLDSIARQTPGLNIARWHADRHTDRREEQTTAEDQVARAIGLHVTPAFRIGKTGAHMTIFTGRTTIQYPEQKHPIALIEAPDVANAIELLDHGEQIPPANQTSPKILSQRLE